MSGHMNMIILHNLLNYYSDFPLNLDILGNLPYKLFVLKQTI